MKPIKKIHASAAAFMQGLNVFTRYDSGCLRKILINSWGYRVDIPNKSKEIGALNEERYEAKLKAAGTTFERESSCSVPLVADGSVHFSGRRDFVVNDGEDREIVELKATSSKTKLQMMKEGKYAVENLAQLIAYMIEAEASKGRLIYSYYKPGTSTPAVEREYVVTVDEFGSILVDGSPSPYTILDYLTHRESAVDALQNDTVYPRPYNYDANFGSPCEYCPFKMACDLYDNNLVQNLKNALDVK